MILKVPFDRVVVGIPEELDEQDIASSQIVQHEFDSGSATFKAAFTNFIGVFHLANSFNNSGVSKYFLGTSTSFIIFR